MWEMMMFCWNWIIAHHMALAPTAEAQRVSKWGGLSAAPYARMHWALGTLIFISLQLPWNFQQDYSLQIAGLLSYCLDSHLNSFFPWINPSLIELQHSGIEHTDPAWSQCWPWVNQTNWGQEAWSNGTNMKASTAFMRMGMGEGVTVQCWTPISGNNMTWLSPMYPTFQLWHKCHGNSDACLSGDIHEDVIQSNVCSGRGLEAIWFHRESDPWQIHTMVYHATIRTSSHINLYESKK